ncbi:hypothetical protein VNO77_41842 [Canavalia gladiata]|uniref:Uncharacterized protein n=1 Tax=Canavalia gladiata TaxID=3824 RepID=A0AAN9PQH8_CANGL
MAVVSSMGCLCLVQQKSHMDPSQGVFISCSNCWRTEKLSEGASGLGYNGGDGEIGLGEVDVHNSGNRMIKPLIVIIPIMASYVKWKAKDGFNMTRASPLLRLLGGHCLVKGLSEDEILNNGGSN